MKDIKGFEGKYAITSCGKVWSHKRQAFLKPYDNGRGYLKVSLYKNGIRHAYFLQRLVAEAYIPNDDPEHKTQVNHKSENKYDNSVNNLEWLSQIDNCNYGTRNQRLSKPVYCVELDRVFKSQTEAAAFINKKISSINNCVRGRTKTAGGYHWEYAKEAN